MPIRGEEDIGGLDITMDDAFVAKLLDADNLEGGELIRGGLIDVSRCACTNSAA